MNEDPNLPDLRPAERFRDNPTIGRFRLPADLEPIETTFVLFVFLSIVGTAILTVVTLKEAVDKNNGTCESNCTFAILLLITLVFALIYTINGIFCEQAFELFVSILATIILMLYCFIEFGIKGYKDSGEKYRIKLGRLIAIAVLGSVDIMLGCFIGIRFHRNKNLIFRTVGANGLLQSMCQTMFSFTAFLKFDFQLVVSLLVLVLSLGTSLTESLILGLGVPISLAWVALGFSLVRFENVILSKVFWVTSCLEPGYIIYLYIVTAEHMKDKDQNATSSKLLNICIMVGGIVALIVRIIVIALSCFVTKNFGKGLKEKVYGGQQRGRLSVAVVNDDHPNA